MFSPGSSVARLAEEGDVNLLVIPSVAVNVVSVNRTVSSAL
jgi:hypothetical protein